MLCCVGFKSTFSCCFPHLNTKNGPVAEIRNLSRTTFVISFTRSSIPSLITKIAVSTALYFFRFIRQIKRGLQTLGGLMLALFAPIGRLVLRWLILPIYRGVVTLKLKLHRWMAPAHGSVFFLFGNRYLFHATLGVVTVATILANSHIRQALAQEVGQNSLLYALATESSIEIVQEQAPNRSSQSQAVAYLADETLMAIPHIDFDYEETEPEIASIDVPGSISAARDAAHEGQTPRAPRTKTESYVVQTGDTLGAIAEKFDVNIGTILWSNGLTERQYIRPGDTLKVPPVSGVLVTLKNGDTLAKLAQTYDAKEETIREFNKITDEKTLAVGTELILPGGRPPEPKPTVTIATRSTDKASAKQPSASVSAGPRPADVDTKELPAARLLWPTPGHVITQKYGWRHTGVDIDGDFTSPLYASYDGVVTTAGWNSGGYGLQILIKHPNGMMTRYAHASKLFVKVGDTVKRGQVIAMMGSTGRSTGSHLHYEVYVGGTAPKNRVNPLNYIR